MAALSSLYSSVRLYAQQCPDATIDKYLIEAIREFCKESWYYQASIQLDQTSGTDTYVIVPSNNDEVIAIQSAEQDGSVLSPLTQEDIGNPNLSLTGYQFEPPNYFVVAPEPTETIANSFQLRLVLMPPENTTTIPDSIYRNYKETIVSGALARILALSNEAWSNPQLAAFKVTEFMVGVWKAKGERMRGFISGSIRIRPRGFL